MPAWRYYGNNGAGFSIGFKKEYFLRRENFEKRDALLLHKVEYQDTQFYQIQEIFDIADKIFSDWRNNDSIILCPYISVLVNYLLAILLRVKNEDYKDEKEWRLCMVRIFNEKNNSWSPCELPIVST